MTHLTPPSAVLDDLRRLTTLELSLPARLGYVGLLLVAAAMTTIVTALLLTEPALPQRTSISLAVLALMGLGWVAFSGWVLTHRRILLGRHQLVAGRMAVTFTAVFSAGAIAIAYATSSAAAAGAAAMGLVMFAIAMGMLMRARRGFEQLSKRRDELERQLATRGR